MSALWGRSWKLWARDFGVGFGFYILFCYLTFPWDAVRQRLEGELTTAFSTPQSPATVSITGARSNWLTGIELDRVMLARPDPTGGAPKAALVTDLRLRASFWAIVRGAQDVTFSAHAMGGELEGEIADSKKLSSLSLDGKALQLTDARDLLGFFGASSGMDLSALDLAGTATLKGDLSFKPNDFASVKGRFTLEVEHALIRGGTVAEYDLPQIDLGRIDLAAHVQEGKLEVERFKIDSPDLTVEADSISLTLNQNLVYSMPHGKLRLHVGEDLQKRVPFLGMGLSALKQPDRDGFYSLPLGGTLKSPRLM